MAEGSVSVSVHSYGWEINVFVDRRPQFLHRVHDMEAGFP